MKRKFSKEVHITHSEGAGYQTDNDAFDSAGLNRETSQSILNIEAALTKYLSYPEYLTQDLNLTSLFFADRYAVFLRVKRERDNRNYCDTTLKIASFIAGDEPFELDFYSSGIFQRNGDEFQQAVNDNRYIEHYNRSILKAAVSDSYKVVVFVNSSALGLEEKLVSYTFLNAVPQKLINNFNYYSFINGTAVNDFKLGIFYCRTEMDRDRYLTSLDSEKAFIFDLTQNIPTFQCSIKRPPYSHRVIDYICDQVTGSKNLPRDICSNLDYMMGQNSSRWKTNPNRSDWYDAMTRELLIKYYKDHTYGIGLTNDELNGIKRVNDNSNH